jgi:hypothetical protein
MTRLVPVGAVLLLAASACTSSRLFVSSSHEGWEAQSPPSEATRAYRVYLIGDAGKPTPATPVLRLLRSHLDVAGEQTAVVFLGDNLYTAGLPDSSDTASRATAEARLNLLLGTVASFRGRVVFIPGNHDWNNSRPGGLAAVQRQEAYIEAVLDRGNTFLPDGGLPGPVSIKLTDELRLLVLDTEWMLRQDEKAFGDAGDFEVDEPEDVLFQLNDLLQRNRNRKLLVVGHHPLFSNGEHAGYFPLRQHLMPPLLGSLAPLYIRYFGGRQDLAHPRYRALRTALTKLFNQHDGLVYAAGHEHNLQYTTYAFEGRTLHHVVSGGGYEGAPVAAGNGAHFTHGHPGFAVLDYYRDGQVWLSMWEPEGEGGTGQVVFRTQVSPPSAAEPAPEAPPLTDGTPSALPSGRTVTQPINPNYAAGPLKEALLGAHHRRAWTTAVTAPVLDLGTAEGGLTPIGRGGGQQTISLQLENPDGKQFVLRSLDKDPSKTVPGPLQGTVATAIVQDQISAIHPYGAFIIPPLAQAAGIYHTTPRLVFVPDDPRLGPYRATFGNQLLMLEDRPDGDMSDSPNYGGSDNVLSAFKLYRQINGDNDHRIDQQAFVRARLFDMLLSDWDRHRDQWRWAAFEPPDGEGKLYRPIPRDRDWAFNRMDGLFPTLTALFFDPKFQDFDEGYGYLIGLSKNGFEQDRRFLNALTLADWQDAAAFLRRAITDATIDDAVRLLPEAVYALNGAAFARLLKLRRDQLPQQAEAYYRLLARVPDVVGSNKHERFEVTRLNDRETQVVVFKTSKSGEKRKEIYRRTFFSDETKEIRLYGQDGNDTFVVEGDVGKGPRVIAVGGGGADTFADRSRVRGLRRKTHFYDAARGNAWETGPETKAIRRDDPAVNAYDPVFGFAHDVRAPQVFFGYNDDDGLFVGGGMQITRHGFRRTPFARQQSLKANFAARTQAYNLLYEGHFTEALGPWALGLEAEIRSPNNIRNFYGLGNETDNTEAKREFYEARLRQTRVAPTLRREQPGSYAFYLGPTFEITRVREDASRFIPEPQPGLSPTTFDDQYLGGLAAGLMLEAVDHPANPRQGVRWNATGQFNVGLGNTTKGFSTLASDLVVYRSLSFSPQVTLAGRLGGAHNLGAFPFYEAVTLGGKENLRGYRSTRYAGRSSFYQSLELRAELFRFSTYLALGQAGLLGFLDNGRVWTDGERSTTWHQGYGGGLWLAFFDAFVLNTTVGFSEDDRTFTMKVGFLY